ncbi:MAG: CHAT domain-containing protein [Paludibacteraceae bacterium]|nr:CHAT domain-containing protein [Paludibacteraceae bacterium]MBR0309523.1 CHAT domain-containing protein [Paludibacteraceae bacterium]
MKRTGIVAILLLLSLFANAQVDEKKYAAYTEKITQVLKADANNTQALKKGVTDILSRGNPEQCYWLAQQLLRIETTKLNPQAETTWLAWELGLIERLAYTDTLLNTLRNGRTLERLEQTFYPHLPVAKRLKQASAMLKQFSHYWDARAKIQAFPQLDTPQMRQAMYEPYRMQAHYIEWMLFGNDSYASAHLSPAPTDAIEKIVRFTGYDAFVNNPPMLTAYLSQLPIDQCQPVLKVTGEIFTYCMYYLSEMDLAVVGHQIMQAAEYYGTYDHAKEQLKETVLRLLAMQYSANQESIESIIASSRLKDRLSAFEAYQDSLRMEGYGFVDYAPNYCPEELRNSQAYDDYLDRYLRFGYDFCKEIESGSGYKYPSLLEQADNIVYILRRMGYYHETIRPDLNWQTRFALCVCELTMFTEYVYGLTHAAWTVGAAILELNLLEKMLPDIPYDEIYRLFAISADFFYFQLGNEKCAKYLLDNYLLPVLPRLSLLSADDYVNCYLMEFYTYVLPLIERLYDEPERSELATFYAERLEQAVRFNPTCWQNPYALRMVAQYWFFEKGETDRAIKLYDEFLAQTQDSVLYSINRCTIAEKEKDYPTAAYYMDIANRDDSTVIALMCTDFALTPSRIYALAGDKTKARQQLDLFKSYMRKEFGKQLLAVGDQLASDMLNKYEGVNNGFVQNFAEPQLADMKADYACACYDWQLLSKGLLLALNGEADTLLAHHPDTVIRQMYVRMKQRERELKEDKNQSFDAIVQQINVNRAKNNLQTAIQEYVDKEGFAGVNLTEWQEVRDALQPNEVAIEFVNGKVDEDSSLVYYALLLRHNDACPQVIELFREQDLLKLLDKNKDSLHVNDTYLYERKGKQLTQLIWSNVLPYLHAGDVVCFSASGILHLLAIESLPYDPTRILSEVYAMRRVSSTRELVTRRPAVAHAKATLYGGIRYNANADEMLTQSAPYRSLEMGHVNDTTNRGSAAPLPGTAKEIEQIRQTLSDRHVQVQTFSSSAANEESFKALSGTGQNILHVATHGFYWPQDMAQSLSSMNQYSAEYLLNPLNRCGLLFAGANMTLSGHGDRLPPGVQDGILTAQEISRLDFRQADIVVLSACETGLGEVSGEGVFGLQRAFKKAGARTLLMALWKVNDEATRMLMTAFYRYYGQGQSKREALLSAQNEVRNYTRTEERTVTRYLPQTTQSTNAKDKMQNRGKSPTDAAVVTTETVTVQPYKDPYFWAGFVLLD